MELTLGVLFGLSILSSNFPPSYLKGNTPVKVLLFAALAGYLLSWLSSACAAGLFRWHAIIDS